MKPGLLISWPAQMYPDHTAVIFGKKRCTFREYDLRINRLAHGLLGLELPKGTRVAVLMNNHMTCMEVFFAITKTGLPVVSLNTRHSVNEHAYILNDSGAEVLIFDRDFFGIAEALRPKVPHLRNYIVNDGKVEGMLSLGDLVKNQPDAEPEVDVSEDDMERIHYTSGTSGRPKGVVVTQEQQYHRLTHVLINLDQPVGPTDLNLNVGPLTHAAGLMFMVYYIKGATNIILEKFDPEKVLQIIEKEKVTSVLLIPAMLIRMLNVPHIRSYDLSSLRRIWYGTAPMPAERLKEAIQIFGPIFRQNYGMSEAPQPLTYLGPEDHRVEGPEKVTRRLSSAGRPALGVDLKVVNEDFKPVKPGEVGEIVYRSRHMFREYWNCSEETAKAFRNGWFLSRDMATVDEEGYVYIIDRKHDMIISGGFNIYPREVEEAILKHPGIAEAAVIGIPDDVWGEAVKAICTLKEGLQVTSEEVIEVCKQNLASYKKPQTVEFVAELPKNNYGKIERKKLKEKYWQGYLRRVN